MKIIVGFALGVGAVVGTIFVLSANLGGITDWIESQFYGTH